MRPPPRTTANPPRSGPEMLPAYAVCVLTMAAAIVWAVVTLTHLGHPALRAVSLHLAADHVLVGLGIALTGMVFAARRTARVLGGLMLCAGCALTLAQTVPLIAVVADAGPRVFTAVVVLSMIGFTLINVIIYPLPLWLPSGRFPRGWGPPYAAFTAVWAALQQYYDFTRPGYLYYGLPTPFTGPFWEGVDRLLMPWMDVAVVWVPPALVSAGLLIMLVRWPRTPKSERPYAVLAVPYVVFLVVICVNQYAHVPEGVGVVMVFLAAAAWPATVGYVHVRERTWALDRAGRRILTAFVLTFAFFMAYAGGAFVLSYFAPGSLTPEAALMAVLTLIIGALLRPTARRAGRMVDRYYYGERAQPYQAVRKLADRLSHALDPGDMPRLVCDTVVHTLRLPGARLVIHTRHGSRELARLGSPGSADEAFPLVHRDHDIGHLYVPAREGELALDQQDREAVRVLADHSAPAIASLQLYEDLQTSREQIVLAREEERRRLRHDLHDGLGPALSGLRLQVDAARAAVPPGTRATASLSTVSEGIGRAIDELRRITGGLAPAALDGADLPRALRQLAEHLGRTLRITVSLAPEPFPGLPAAVEVALYRIAAEALNNVVRHARADHAHATVVLTPEAVTVEIRDDGSGVPEGGPGDGGVGLRSMAERAEELGGTFSLVSTEAGTLVRAVLPRTAGTGAGPADHAPGTRGFVR
ncbi:histidine kinase [Streptomyces sp. NBC_00249]|uniref:sensor histidine kinase n=1 Tax=Streptomyces sp. NBC_00249 TaxID=2975690 RepID=UPI002255639C|nr:GAF domain-containing sensor histidine kinase [Streptomyces sp. NBC_00249]MCX5192563.1 histidine kinase [Streptomyces sp. NBC_00249]